MWKERMERYHREAWEPIVNSGVTERKKDTERIYLMFHRKENYKNISQMWWKIL